MSKYTMQYPIWDKETRANPQAMYEQMRNEAPIFHEIGPQTGRGFWFFTRYEDCVAVLKDQRFGKEFWKHLEPELIAMQPGGNGTDGNVFDAINRHMLNLDPPDHTRLRFLVHKAFTPRMIDNLRPRIQEIANDLINEMKGKTEIDLLADFGFPLPITVIAEMLGVPAADRNKFRDWTRALLFGMSEADSMTAVMEFMMYMHNMIDERRETPRDDVLSALVNAEEAGDKLDRQELLSMIFLLLVAGHETTVNLIGNGTLALMQNPDQMQKLRANPQLIGSAVEEMLRYNGPVETPTTRWAFEDVVINGVTIPKGDLVMPSLLGANRDPAVFENPNTFDITRDPNRHIAFGSGIHFCLGAPLARMEGAIAINTLLGSVAHIELACPVDSLEWNDQLLLHGMKALPVTIGQ